MIKVALCGMGYWGKNLFRVLSSHPEMRLVAVIDRKKDALDRVRMIRPEVALFEDLETALRMVDFDAVVIATPVQSHYKMAALGLDAGKHVMVEKPFCSNSDEASDLVARAHRYDLALMVDHTFLFHPAVRKFKALLNSGSLGRVSYFDSQRVNLGLFQPDVNVLWDLAPHDLSIIDFLFGSEPLDIEASGYCHINPLSPDIAYVTLHYPNEMVAHLNLSWMSPVKMRRIAVGGSAQMAVWDDLDRDEPLKIYDSGINFLSEDKRETILPTYRVGSVHSPRLSHTEPLVDAVEHFRRVILGDEICWTDGSFGMRIVRTLEWAQARLDQNLRRVRALADYRVAAIAAE